MEFSGHEPSPKSLGSAVAKLGFQIQGKKGMKDVVGQESEQ
jgi:hypothetical protein